MMEKKARVVKIGDWTLWIKIDLSGASWELEKRGYREVIKSREFLKKIANETDLVYKGDRGKDVGKSRELFL